MKKIKWAPKVCICETGKEQEIKKFDPIDDQQEAVKFAEKIYDETTNAAWFGVERVVCKL